MARRLVAPADLVPQREGHLGATSIPPGATGATRRGATREPSRASMLAANRLGIRFDKLGGEAHRAIGASKGRGSARARRGTLPRPVHRERDAGVANPLTRHGSRRSGTLSGPRAMTTERRQNRRLPSGCVAGGRPRGVAVRATLRHAGALSRRDMRARTTTAGGGTISDLLTASAALTERGSPVLDRPPPAKSRSVGLTSPWTHRWVDEVVRVGPAAAMPPPSSPASTGGRCCSSVRGRWPAHRVGGQVAPGS